jgi:L-ascorbate metabolism protein UlaG (beta-lactamase superfamily)
VPVTVGKSDHFDGRRFRNLDGPAGQPFTAVPRMLGERRTPWPRRIEVAVRKPAPLGGASAVVTFVGHATFLIQTPAGNILTDPMYSDVAGPLNRFGPRRVRQPAVRFDDLPPIATVLLSHNHYDHCDLATLRALARRFDPAVITPLGNTRLVRSVGMRRVTELDWWEETTIGGGPVTLTPARHFSARTPFDRNRALWGGFVFRAGDRRLYFAGDTAYGSFFRDVSTRLGPIDFALIPIGAYEPRWFMHVVHMNPAEAVQAHLDVGAAASVGMHFGTFPLTAEAVDEPPRALAEARLANGVEEAHFRVPEFGESIAVR